MTSTDALLDRIRRENLGVYRESPKRLREDVSQEAEIAHDYRGRLVYELLQNADDAMQSLGASNDRVVFRLTQTDLWVGNSGRPLDDGDVEGLCGTGISTKIADGPKRASIGHKGMGFKSVLEVTEQPAAYSVGHSFRMSATDALQPVADVLLAKGQVAPTRVPAMRFPWPVDEESNEWSTYRAQGIRTLFRFPLRADLTGDQRHILAERLRGLPVTALVFLKHLEQVDIEIDTGDGRSTRSLHISRERRDAAGWLPCTGLGASGTYRISIETNEQEQVQFLLAHDGDVPIGAHRSGLDPFAWSGIETSEVSVATPWPIGGAEPAGDWRRFHVFLPTAEGLPQPLLVNGAFATDLSRQEIRLGPEADDYNQYLAREAARLVRDTLAPAILEESGPAEVLATLDRDGVAPNSPIARAFHEGLRDAFADLAFIPGPEGTGQLAVDRIVVPPTTLLDAQGSAFRDLLPDDAGLDNRRFPASGFCEPRLARVLVDLGALEIAPGQAVKVLSGADPHRCGLRRHPGGRAWVDPVLEALEFLWRASDEVTRTVVGNAARAEAVFPIAVRPDGTVERIATADVTCFYPPRSFSGGVPLERLCFLLQEVCWGELVGRERNDVLRDQLVVWQALFSIRDFKFPDVMRAAVLPALDLEQGPETSAWRSRLESIDRLAAICQLAGRTPKPMSSLPFQRLGSDRALFNMARLPVPVRAGPDGVTRWLPAFRVYFGTDWTADESAELLFETMSVASPDTPAPEVAYLAGPDHFIGHLARYRSLHGAADDEPSDEEVGLDEDEEQALETDELERWRAILSWLGVNRSLRPVHFHDVEEQRAGWIRTRGLSKPDGHAFAGVSEKVWRDYRAVIDDALVKINRDQRTPFFYELHDLEHAPAVLAATGRDKHGSVADALFKHLSRNWGYLEQFSRLEVALVPNDRDPGKRTKPIRPLGDELREAGPNFWLWRLRRRPVVPTSHGPRTPGRAWLPSPEIDRRFGRRAGGADALIPIVRLPADEPRSRSRALTFARVLGLRDEFSPATFRVQDAQGLCERLVELYGPAADGPDVGLPFELDERTLRSVIRPAYRNLFELLVGAVERSKTDDAPLGEVPLLEMDGAGRYRFRTGRQILYQERSGTRERIGAVGGLWTFVLESTPSARAPLVRVFGARILEEAVRWAPSAGEPHLDEAERGRFRDGLLGLRPYLLARLRAERNEDAQVRQDARRLGSFIDRVLPVEDLRVACWLDDRQLSSGESRDAYVDVGRDASIGGFVRWGEAGWPPTPNDAEALAAGLADLFQVSMFEPFLALIGASSHEARIRLLRLAGAPTDLDEVLARAEEAHEEGDAGLGGPPVVPTSAPGADPDDVPVEGQTHKADVGRVPLWRPEDLVLAGLPVIMSGESTTDGGGDGHPPGGWGAPGGGGSYGNQATDLDELNRVGMSVAIAYEAHRVGAGAASSVVFDPLVPATAATALVFDVSTPPAVAAAISASPRARAAFEALSTFGVTAEWPGFDVLTLAHEEALPDRLIELKSSGVHATVQTMSWNEWKSARDSRIRGRFWLYLAGNLRSDLAAARPFIQGIQDPFGSLLSTVVTAPVRRAVQLDVRRFDHAEFLELDVRSDGAASDARY